MHLGAGFTGSHHTLPTLAHSMLGLLFILMGSFLKYWVLQQCVTSHHLNPTPWAYSQHLDYHCPPPVWMSDDVSSRGGGTN